MKYNYLMKIARTIISYYNGSKYIEQQVNSILSQALPEGYKHELIIYDDFSKEEEFTFLKSKYGNNELIRIIKNEENRGIAISYIEGFNQALKDNVDVLFLADQDDIFLEGKYLKHIALHNTSNKALVITSDNRWFFEQDLRKPRKSKNHSAHNMSIDIKLCKDNVIESLDKLVEGLYEERKVNSLIWQWVGFIYHDTLISMLFTNANQIYGTKDLITCDWRNYATSFSTNSGLKEVIYQASHYNWYFYCVKPLFMKTLNIKISIRKFNLHDRFADPSKVGGWFKWHFDNFAMYLRIKYLRDFVHISTDVKNYKNKIKMSGGKNEN